MSRDASPYTYTRCGGESLALSGSIPCIWRYTRATRILTSRSWRPLRVCSASRAKVATDLSAVSSRSGAGCSARRRNSSTLMPSPVFGAGSGELSIAAYGTDGASSAYSIGGMIRPLASWLARKSTRWRTHERRFWSGISDGSITMNVLIFLTEMKNSIPLSFWRDMMCFCGIGVTRDNKRQSYHFIT